MKVCYFQIRDVLGYFYELHVPGCAFLQRTCTCTVRSIELSSFVVLFLMCNVKANREPHDLSSYMLYGNAYIRKSVALFLSMFTGFVPAN